MDDGAATHGGGGAHVLLLPFPGMQGHANPMVQLGRRLAFHGLRPTLVLSRHVLSTTSAATSCPFPVAAISDGFDAGGISSCPDVAEYLRRMEAAGSETLAALLGAAAGARAGRRVRVLVYDSHLPWARRVARAAGVAAAAFLTQMCAVDLVYGEAWAGRVALPLLPDGGALALRRSGMLGVELGPDDVPPFVAAPQRYPAFTASALSQFDGLEHAADVLVNSFRDLEPTEADYLDSTWRAKTVGPTLPSFFLDDGRLPRDRTYGVDLSSGGTGSEAPCSISIMAWLDKQEPCSVVLASYGTVASLDAAQLEELGNGLCDSGKPFVWVLRSGEAEKLSRQLGGRCEEEARPGRLASSSPSVLSSRCWHTIEATGCFLTHCGWNSTIEAIASGVPMVAMPQWADQPTAAKYVESAWGIGVRMRKGKGKGLVRREEVERCVREVMKGERKDEYRQNAARWMNKAKEAMHEGGSSDKNIAEFAAKYLST